VTDTSSFDQTAPDALSEAGPDAVPDVVPDTSEPEGGCTDGTKVSCYEGPAGTKGVGVCKAGSSTCESGAWGPCTNQVLPSSEVCNGLDDDCDNAVDPNCACVPNESENCGTDTGECEMGTRSCTQDGEWGACEGGKGPTAEVCDGKDNDCNGSADDAIATPSCYTGPDGTQGIGLCKAGLLTCVSAQQICANQVLPVPEICGNDVDEDCTGADELCAICVESQPVIFPSACGASCVASTTDADCDGMAAGDPSQVCNTLLFFDGFKSQPDASTWTLSGTTAWDCGWLKLKPASGAGAISDPNTNPSADNIVEARVKLGPAVAGDFRVGIRSSISGSLFRNCEIWSSAQYSFGKPGIHLVVSGTGGSSGSWSPSSFVLDASEGKTYILRLTGKGANTTCQVLNETGATVLHSLSSSSGGSFQPGSISVYANTREAHVDYVSVYSW